MADFVAALESRRSQGRGDYSSILEEDEKAQALRDALASERAASSDQEEVTPPPANTSVLAQKEITPTPADATGVVQKTATPSANINPPAIGEPLQTAKENPAKSEQDVTDDKDKEDEPKGSAILNGLMRRFQL